MPVVKKIAWKQYSVLGACVILAAGVGLTYGILQRTHSVEVRVTETRALVAKGLNMVNEYALNMAAHPLPNPINQPSLTIRTEHDGETLSYPPRDQCFGYLPPDLPTYIADISPGHFARARDNAALRASLIDRFSHKPLYYARGRLVSAAIVISVGPDGQLDLKPSTLTWIKDVLQPPPVNALYDPTNGLYSRGDIAAFY